VREGRSARRFRVALNQLRQQSRPRTDSKMRASGFPASGTTNSNESKHMQYSVPTSQRPSFARRAKLTNSIWGFERYGDLQQQSAMRVVRRHLACAWLNAPGLHGSDNKVCDFWIGKREDSTAGVSGTSALGYLPIPVVTRRLHVLTAGQCIMKKRPASEGRSWMWRSVSGAKELQEGIGNDRGRDDHC
jgi:hypothetical protein